MTKPALLFATALFLISCGDQPAADRAITQATATDNYESDDAENEQVSKVREIFHAVPSPMDMATVIREAGTKYEVSLLNDVKNVNEYSTARSRALNLGIYGADLSYASIYNQNQESILFMSCTKKLSDNLGLSRAFNDHVIERMEENVDNRDSLLSIVSETYYMLDAYLKENDRDHLSAMIIAAGWIEGLYLATSVTKEAVGAHDKLRTRIAEQKYSLQDLLALVNSYNRNGELDGIIADLEELNRAYEEVKINRESGSLTVQEDGTTRLGGKTTPAMTDESLEKITHIVREIRTRYITA